MGRKSLSEASAIAVIIYAILIVAFTWLGLALAPQPAQIGGPRPLGSIPLHASELIGFGVLLGGVSIFVYGLKGIPLVVLSPTLVVLLDLDHLPAYIGMAQPIRPAHSFVFILTVLVFTAIILRRLDLELVILSSFLGHLGIDTGIFPLFAPASFEYYQLGLYRVLLLVGAAVVALIAGFMMRRSTRPEEAR